MTLDELQSLTSALLVDLGATIEGLRKDSGELLSSLTDEEFLLAVRFLAGEKVAQLASIPELAPRRRREPVEISPEEQAERLARLEELDEETPRGPVELTGNQFDGVTLL